MSTAMSVTPKDLMKQWRQDKNETPFFINFLNSTSYPRDEAFTDMLTYTLFSTFKYKSLTFVIMTVNTLFYIFSLFYGGVQIGGALLQPTQLALYDFGMNYSYFTRYQHQVHRLFLSLFLFANFVHFFCCQLGWAIYGSYVERLIGWKKLWMVGVVSGVGGTLLSCSFTPFPHVDGSSLPSTFIGFLLGYLLINWDQWDFSGSGRWQMMGWLIFGVVIMIWEGRVWVLVDQLAELGSFILGILCSLVVIKSLDKENSQQNDTKCTSIVSFILILAYYIGVIAYFYMYTHPVLIPN